MVNRDHERDTHEAVQSKHIIFFWIAVWQLLQSLFVLGQTPLQMAHLDDSVHIHIPDGNKSKSISLAERNHTMSTSV